MRIYFNNIRTPFTGISELLDGYFEVINNSLTITGRISTCVFNHTPGVRHDPSCIAYKEVRVNKMPIAPDFTLGQSYWIKKFLTEIANKLKLKSIHDAKLILPNNFIETNNPRLINKFGFMALYPYEICELLYLKRSNAEIRILSYEAHPSYDDASICYGVVEFYSICNATSFSSNATHIDYNGSYSLNLDKTFIYTDSNINIEDLLGYSLIYEKPLAQDLDDEDDGCDVILLP